MSLPSASSLGTAVHRWSAGSTATATPSSAAAESFAAMAETSQGGSVQTSKMSRGYREIPGYGRVETVKVTETHVGPDGKPVNTVKELVVCPECGTLNCACLARVTLQARVDEENASGVKGQEKPSPMAIMPGSFNQLSANFSASQGHAPRRMFG